MSVKAVTPRLPAIGGGLQFYRDADFFDADQDERAVGDIFNPEWPDKPIRLKPTPGKPRQASARSALRAHPDARERGPRVSLDGRSALSPSFSGQLGGGPAERTPAAARQRTPSSALPGARTPEEQSRPGWSPDGS